MSVCHQPAAARLTVVVLKARNLPKMDITGMSGEKMENSIKRGLKLSRDGNGDAICQIKTASHLFLHLV